MSGGKAKYFRKRSLVYAAVLVALFVGLGVSVASRQPVDVEMIRAIESPYTQNTRDDGSVEIVNHYRVHLKNQTFDPVLVSIRIDGEGAESIELVAPTYPVTIAGGATDKNHVFFKFPSELTAATGRFDVVITLELELPTGMESVHSPAVLVGPFGTGASP